MKKLIYTAMILLWGNLAFSQGESAATDSIHKQILNNNQGMSLEEIQKFYTRRFHKLDLDRSGSINFDEFKEIDVIKQMHNQMPSGPEYQDMLQALLKQTMQQHDQDADGGISLEEYLALSLPFAKRLDSNSDDFISVDEVNADKERRQGLIKSLERMEEYESSLSQDMESLDKKFDELDGIIESMEKPDAAGH